MFDFDAGKFLIIGIVALIVIGPKELPRVLRQVGQTVGRVRRMASEFQGQFMDAMKEADLETIRQDLKKIGDDTHAELNTHFDPARDIQRELTASLEAPAVAAAIPAMAEAPAIGGHHFDLPHPQLTDTTSDDDESGTLAAAGLAPVVDDAFLPAADLEPAVPVEQSPVGSIERPAQRLDAKKRKIVVAKRQALATQRTHAVCDRTAIERLRPPRARGQEIAQR